MMDIKSTSSTTAGNIRIGNNNLHLLLLASFCICSYSRNNSAKRRRTNKAPEVIRKIFHQNDQKWNQGRRKNIPYDVNEHPFEYYHRHGRSLANNMSKEDVYNPIRITFDVSNLDEHYSTASEQDQMRIRALMQEILPQTAKDLAEAISLASVQGGIPIDPDDCWGVPPISVAGDVYDTDLFIIVYAEAALQKQTICCDKCGTLAAAAACSLDQFDRPVSGFINFCLNEIQLSDDGQQIMQDAIDETVDTAKHELTHVLGFHSEMYKYFRNPETGEPLTPRPFCESLVHCIDGAISSVELPSTNTLQQRITPSGDTVYYEIVTPTVLQVTRNQFDCQNATGARLETHPTTLLYL